LESVIYSQEGTCDMIPKVVNKMHGKLDKYVVTWTIMFICSGNTHTFRCLSVCHISCVAHFGL